MKEKNNNITWIDAARYREMSDYDKSNIDVMFSFSDLFIIKNNKQIKNSNKDFGLGVLDNDNIIE